MPIDPSDTRVGEVLSGMQSLENESREFRVLVDLMRRGILDFEAAPVVTLFDSIVTTGQEVRAKLRDLRDNP